MMRIIRLCHPLNPHHPRLKNNNLSVSFYLYLRPYLPVSAPVLSRTSAYAHGIRQLRTMRFARLYSI